MTFWMRGVTCRDDGIDKVYEMHSTLLWKQRDTTYKGVIKRLFANFLRTTERAS